MPYSFKSVKTRYIFSGLVICLISLFLVSVSSYLLSLRITSEQAESRIRESALRNAAELDSWFAKFDSILEDTVEDLGINNRLDRDYLLQVLKAKLSRYDEDVFDFYIGLEDPDQPLISAIGWIPDGTYDPRGRTWYIKASRTDNTIFTEPYIDAQTGKMVITLARRIVRNGNLLGVMAADIFISDVLEKVQEYRLSENSYAFLLDDSANFVSHPEAAFQPGKEGLTNVHDLGNSDYALLLETLSREQTHIRKGTDFTGRQAYFMVSRIPSNHWLFGISIPDSDYRKPLHLLLKGFLAVTVISMLVSLVIMLGLVDGLVNPIRALAETIGNFSGTNLDVRAEVTSKDEIGKLGTIFNRMADTIGEYSRSLERQVNERTHEVRQKTRRIQESIEYAKTIQEAILPDRGELESVLKEHLVIWEPRDTVGGDFYWFRAFSDGFVAILGDCTGHGVPGALMTVAATSLLNRIITEERHHDPTLILQELNSLLHQTLQPSEGHHIEDGLDAAVLCVDGDLEQGLFAGAGLSLLVSDGAEIREIKGNRQGIGFASFQNGVSFSLRELEIHPGTAFYMATDGLRDQVGEKTGLPFGRTRLKDLLASVQSLTMRDQKDRILHVFNEYKGEESVRDDIALFGFRI